MKKLLWIGVLLTLIGGIVYTTRINSKPKESTPTKPARGKLPAEATVTLTKDGFTPAEVKIKVGGAVRWKNESGDKQTVNSDDYPTNQKHKELNFGIFNDGSTVVYTFTKQGEYGYHNQFKPEQKGKIIVE